MIFSHSLFCTFLTHVVILHNRSTPTSCTLYRFTAVTSLSAFIAWWLVYVLESLDLGMSPRLESQHSLSRYSSSLTGLSVNGHTDPYSLQQLILCHSATKYALPFLLLFAFFPGITVDSSVVMSFYLY